MPLIVIAALADQIVSLLFGPGYADATLVLRILAPGVICFALSQVSGPVIQSRRNAAPLVRVIAGAVTLNVALNWVLIPRFGAPGAAIACALSYGLVAVAHARILRHYGVKPFTGFWWWRLLLVTTGTLAVIAPLAAVPAPRVLLVVAVTLLAGLLYAAGLLRLRLIVVAELQRLIDSLPQAVRAPAAGAFSLVRPALCRLESVAPGHQPASLTSRGD